MSERKIRLRYAGFVNFASNLISIFTGMMFVTMTSRRLSDVEFGLWHYIGILIQYVVIPGSLTNYWLTRYAGRGFRVGKTGLILNSAVMIVMISLYILFLPFVSPPVSGIENLFVLLFFIVILQIPAEYYAASLAALARGVAPQAIGYGQLVLEPMKLIMGYFLVIQLRWKLVGALLSFIIARYAYALFLAFYLRRDLGDSLNLDLMKKWVKLWWLPAYNIVLIGYLNSLDVMIVSHMSNSTVPIAHMKAIQTIIAVILYSNVLASALYPRLLSGGGAEDVKVVIDYVSMFAFPMVFGTMAMAKSFLSLLKVDFTISSDALIVSSIYALLFSFSGILSTCLVGVERVELNEDTTFIDYIKSKLFIVPSARLVVSSLMLSMLYVFLNYVSVMGTSDPAFIVLGWSSIRALVFLILLLYFWFKVKSELNIVLPYKRILKYLSSSLVMFIVLWSIGIGRVAYERFADALMSSVMGVMLGAAIYFSILFVIDEETRKLVRDSIREVRRIIGF